jgi:hypothetical protein
MRKLLAGRSLPFSDSLWRKLDTVTPAGETGDSLHGTRRTGEEGKFQIVMTLSGGQEALN